MIEPTDEIQRAYAEAWFRAIGMDEEDVQKMVAIELGDPMPWRIAALKAVLAIIERDYREQIADALEDYALQLRREFRSGNVGIEYINGIETAAVQVRERRAR